MLAMKRYKMKTEKLKFITKRKNSDKGKRNENTRKCEIVTSIHNLMTKR